MISFAGTSFKDLKLSRSLKGIPERMYEKPPCKVTSESRCVGGAGKTTEATHY